MFPVFIEQYYLTLLFAIPCVVKFEAVCMCCFFAAS